MWPAQGPKLLPGRESHRNSVPFSNGSRGDEWSCNQTFPVQTCTGLGWAVTACSRHSNPAHTARTRGWAPATSPWGCRFPGDGPWCPRASLGMVPAVPVPRCQCPPGSIAHGSLAVRFRQISMDGAGAGGLL